MRERSNRDRQAPAAGLDPHNGSRGIGWSSANYRCQAMAKLAGEIQHDAGLISMARISRAENKRITRYFIFTLKGAKNLGRSKRGERRERDWLHPPRGSNNKTGLSPVIGGGGIKAVNPSIRRTPPAMKYSFEPLSRLML